MSPIEFALCAELEKNIADEAEARAGYYQILTKFASELSLIEIDELEEIISEELKHTEYLRKMVVKRSTIIAEN